MLSGGKCMPNDKKNKCRTIEIRRLISDKSSAYFTDVMSLWTTFWDPHTRADPPQPFTISTTAGSSRDNVA